MIRVVPGDGLGGQVHLDRPHLARIRGGPRCWASGSRARDVLAASGGGMVGAQPLLGIHQAATGQAGLPCSHSRAARTARMWARRPSAGRLAGEASPVSVIPARVSQHQPGPAKPPVLRVSGAAPPRP